MFQGPQAYRNLHAHLKKHDNMLLANQMRAHQLRAERAEEDGFTRITNRIYGTFANYGMNPGRPILYLIGLYAISFMYLYTIDCGTLMQPDDFYNGAYRYFLDKNDGCFYRSLLLPLNSIVNPFGVFFDPRKLIVPTTMLGSVLLTIQGLFSDMLIVMTVLSIRRRFKTE